MPDRTETAAPQTTTFPHLFSHTLGAGALAVFALGLNHVACWGLFVLAALIAWPLWVYRNEVTLLERRMVLEHLTRADSSVRRWLWAGTLTRVVQVVVSLALAMLLLALTARLGAEQWAVLALDVLVLSLLVEPVRRGLRGQIQDQRLGLIARRWPLLGLNLAFLTLAFLAVDFFLTGMPDTRALPWNQVAEDAFRAEGLDAVCAPAGWALGALAAAEALTGHAAQLSIPSLPDRTLRIAAWGVVLFHAGALAYLFTRMQLGIIALVEQRATRAEPEGAFTRAFVYTILALAIPYLYATSRLADLDPERLAGQARRAVDWVDPCRPDPAARKALLASLGAELERARLAARASADQRVDAELDALFARLEPGVDAYLDWYFTVIGEYERLTALATGSFVGLMGKQLEQHLFVDTGFAKQLERLDESIRRDSAGTLAETAENLEQLAEERSAGAPCALSRLNLGALNAATLASPALGDLNRDAMRAATAAGGGAAAVVSATICGVVMGRVGAGAGNSTASARSAVTRRRSGVFIAAP